MNTIPNTRLEYIMSCILQDKAKGVMKGDELEWTASRAKHLSKEYDIIEQRAWKEDQEVAEFESMRSCGKPLDEVAKALANPTTVDTGKLSDGHHTFDELYEHRHLLFLNLCKYQYSWCSKLHSDGTMFEQHFIAGISPGSDLKDDQITYHLPIRLWDEAVRICDRVLDKAPEWDGHTSNDALTRLKELL